MSDPNADDDDVEFAGVNGVEVRRCTRADPERIRFCANPEAANPQYRRYGCALCTSTW